MFPEVQQKERSGYMTFLWKNDPCQNKWYILAKAYSVIRDVQGKANSPVAIFLQINAPFINVAEPASYMGKLGYALDTVVDVDGTVLDHRLYSTHMPIDQGLLVTNASVQDVIANSVNVGYVKTQALMPTADEPLMSMMAVTAQNQQGSYAVVDGCGFNTTANHQPVGFGNAASTTTTQIEQASQMDSAASLNGATGQAYSALGGNEMTANGANEQSTAAETYNNQVNNGATGSDEAEVLPQDNDNQANQGAAGMDFDFGMT